MFPARSIVAFAVCALTLGVGAAPAAAITRTWDGSVNNDWMTADNWTPSGVPSAVDDVVVSFGTPSLAADTAIANFQLSGGNRTGSGVLDAVTGTLAGGGLSGSGTTRFSGAVSITGSALADGHTLELDGVTTWSAGSINFGGSAANQLVNDGTLNITGNVGMGSFGGQDITVTNNGTLNRTSAAGTATLRNLRGPGSINVTSGTLELIGAVAGNVIAGDVTIDAFATLRHAGAATHTGASAITGAGTLGVSGGTLTLAAGAGDTFAPGTFAIVFGEAVAVRSGTPGHINLTGGNRTGSGVLDAVTGTLAGGSLSGSGTTRFSGAVSITGSALADGHTLELDGVTTWSAGSINFGGSAANQLVNDGTLNITGNVGMGSFGGQDITVTNNGTLNRTSAAGTATLRNLRGPGSINVTSGTLELIGAVAGNVIAGDVTIDAFATLRHAGAATHTGASAITGAGTLGVSGGTLTLAAGAGDTFAPGTFAIVFGEAVAVRSGTPGHINLTGGNRTGSGVLDAVTGTLAGGSLSGSGTTRFSGAVSITGSALADGHTLELDGVTTWSAGSINFGGSAANQLVNDGTLNITGNVGMGSFGGQDITVTNNGTLNRTSAAGTATLRNLRGPGSINVTSGTLELIGAVAGNVIAGDVTIDAFATLRHAGAATHTGASAITGAGTLGVSGGTLTLAAGAGDTFAPGTFAIVFGEAVAVRSGTPGHINLTGGNRTGSGVLDAVTGTLAGGGLSGSGTTRFSGAVSITGSALADGHTLELDGVTTWSAGSINFGGSAANQLVNDGTLNITGNVGMGSFGGQDITVTNNGTLNRTSAAGTATLRNLRGPGSINVTSGTLELIGAVAGNVIAGDVTIDAFATLRHAGAATHTGASAITGAGTLGVSGGTLTLAAGAGDTFAPGTFAIVFGEAVAVRSGTPGHINLTGGNRTGSGVLDAVTGTLAGGGLSGSGTTRFSGAVSITGSALADGHTLELDGVTTWSAGSINFGGSAANQLVNDGTLNITGNVGMGSFGGQDITVTNNGTLNRTSAAGTATLRNGVNAGTLNVQTGTLNVTNGLTQQAGSAVVQSGATLGGGVTVTGGTLGGNGTVAGDVSQTGGAIAPGASPGTLTVTGSLTQQPGATVEVEIAGITPGTEFDVLAVGGNAALDGTVAYVQLGGFDPALADVFQFLTSGTRTGTFDAVTGTPLPGGKVYSLDYPAGPPFGARLVLEPPSPPSNLSLPSITGTPSVGQTLTCDPGTWTGSPTFTFQWLLDGTEIPGATASTYTPVMGDATHELSCRVTATDVGGSTDATSAPVTVPATAPQNTIPPAVSGTPAPGQTLTCDSGTFSGAPPPTVTIEWLRDGVPIPGATGSTYTLTADDAGHTITCRATATNAGGSTTATSAGVAVPPPAPPTPTPSPTPTPTPTPTPSPTRTPTPAPSAEEQLAQAPASEIAGAFGLPSARKCISRRNFQIRLRNPRGVRIRRAAVSVDGKLVKVRKVRGRFTARVDLRSLPRGRFTVRIRVTTITGRRLDGTRRYRTCAKKRRRGSTGPI